MNRQRHKIYRIFLYIILTRHVMNDAEKFVHKLKSDIKKRAVSEPFEITRHFAMYRITGCDMDIGNFCRKVAGLYPEREEDDMRYMITIRWTKDIYGYDARDFTKKIIAIIQKYFRHNEKYIIEDNLLLTVDRIKVTVDTFRDEDRTDFKYENEIEQKFTEMVIDYYCIDPFHMILDILITQINLSLRESEGLDYLQEKRDNDTLRDYCTDEYENIIKRLHIILFGKNIGKKLRSDPELEPEPKNFAFERLFEKISIYKEKSLYKHNAEKTHESFRRYFLSLTQIYSKLFKDRTNDVITKFLPIFKLKANKDLFIRNLENLVRQFVYITDEESMYEYFKSNFILHADKFCGSSKDEAILKKYLENIYSNEVQRRNRELYERNKCSTGNFNYIKIVCDKSIAKNKDYANRVCKILQDTNVFDQSYAHHYLYIETQGLSNKNATALCSSMKYDDKIKATTKTAVIDVSLIIKLDNKHTRLHNTQVYRYNRNVTKDYDRNCLSYINVITRMTETYIAIHKSDEPAEQASENDTYSLLRDILDPKYGEILYSHTMPHVSYPGSLFIYIIRPEVVTLDNQIFSIVDDQDLIDILDCFSDAAQIEIDHDSLLKIPTTFIENFGCYINFLNDRNSADLKDQNSYSLDHTNFLYFENTIELEGPYTKNFYTRDFCGRYWIGQNKTLLPFHINIRQIADFESIGSYSSPYVSNILEQIGIEEELLNRLLRRFINNERSKTFLATKLKKRQSYYIEGIDIFVILHADKSYALHLFEVIDSRRVRNIDREISKLHTNMLQYLKIMPTVRALNYITEGLACKPIFTQSVIQLTIKEMQKLPYKDNLSHLDVLKSKVIDIILQRIKMHYTVILAEDDELNKSNKVPKRLYLQAFHKSINPFEIENIAKIIIEELEQQVEIRTIMVTVLTLEKPIQTQKIATEKKSLPLPEVDNEYEVDNNCSEQRTRRGCAIV